MEYNEDESQMQNIVHIEPPAEPPRPDRSNIEPPAEPARPVRSNISNNNTNRPTGTVRPLSPNFDRPLDITLNPSLATAMDWTLYYTLNKTDQALMLDRVFHNDVQALNARRMMSRITRHPALTELVNRPPGLTRAL